jgi:hypothetical protein
MKESEKHVILIRRLTEATRAILAKMFPSISMTVIGRKASGGLNLEALSVTLDNDLLGFCGVALIEGHPEVWLWITDSGAATKHPILVLRTLRRALKSMAQQYQWKMIRCMTAVGADPKFRKFVSILGFKKTGVRLGYGPSGADFTLYELSYQ